MPQEIRIWNVDQSQRLHELQRHSVDLEAHLETWLEQDVSILADDLLLIGRQVETDIGGQVDLLGMDEVGDLVIIELKRDKTPREITAQVLDYAAWVEDLSGEDVIEIADDYMRADGGLEAVFKAQFGHDLPDNLNEDHRMMIVASEIDSKSERIINYLSERHGVSINAVTFQHFKDDHDNSFLARTFLIEPSEVDYRTTTRGKSKRRPNLTYEQLEEMADEQGVGAFYRQMVTALDGRLSKGTTQSSIGFKAKIDGSRKTVFNLIPKESSSEDGLKFQLYLQRFQQALGLDAETIEGTLPANHHAWSYVPDDPDWAGYEGFFTTDGEIDRFLHLLRNTPA